MKIALPVAVIASLFLAGCGKKEAPAVKKHKTVAQADGTVRVSKTTIPTYDYSQELFEDTGVGGMAFVDTQSEQEVVDAQGRRVVAYKQKTSVTETVDRDIPVTWDDAADASKPAFKTVFFDFNKDGIRASERAKVEEDATLVRDVVTSGKKVVVAGHCDKYGSAAYNMALSENRAKTIKDEMVKRGLPGDAIQVVGFGQEVPLVWSDAPDRAQQIIELQPNRRAEIEVL